MGQLAFTFLFAGALVLFSCGSSGEEAANNASPDTTKTDTSMGAKDTLPHLPSPPDPAPAPGTLEIQAQVIDVHEANPDASALSYHLKVVKVLAIGSSTPAVVVKDTLKVKSTDSFKKLEKEITISCTIRAQKMMAGQKDSASAWLLVQWKHINQDH